MPTLQAGKSCKFSPRLTGAGARSARQQLSLAQLHMESGLELHARLSFAHGSNELREHFR